MSLQPVEGVLATIIKVADVDERAAQTLARLSLYEALTEQIEAARPRLEADTTKWMAQQVAKARRVLGDEVSKSDDVAGGLEVIEEFIKLDLIGHALAFFNRTHPRDEKGRFVRQDLGGRTDPNGTRPTRQSGHKSEALQYAQHWKNNKLVDDNTPVQLHYVRAGENGRPLGDSGEGPRHPATVGTLGQRIDELAASEPDLLLSGVSFDRKGIPAGNSRQRAALDAAAMFTGEPHVPAVARMAQALPYDGEQPRNQDANAAEWNRPGSPGDRKSYRRLQLTGRALESISQTGSLGSTVGGMARLIGDLGPEAEKVLGPGVRRTAYRYRGTERRPDPLIVKQVEQAQHIALSYGSDEEGVRERAVEQISRMAAARGEKEPSVGVAALYATAPYQSWTLDRLELALRGDTAAVTLLDAVPDQKLAAISIEAGELPPSQGVMIDADGDIVSQAQGYNGDHYLPFDLRNLSDLHGGQYVRTRAAGGPTTEDIYTGLLSGARQIQVVSNSGVFTLEFDPDLRGGRRYTDKAQRMIGRYSKLLEAIEGGGLYENDVAAEERGKLRVKAYEQMGWDPERGAQQYRVLLERARLQGTVNQDDEDELYSAALAEVNAADDALRQAGRPGLSNQRRAQEIEDLIHEARAKENADKVRRMVLDGKGYAAALKTLKQEFPFFIRDVRYETIQDFVGRRGAKRPETMKPNPYGPDKGRVKPGQTNAESTLGPDDGRRVPTTSRGELRPTAAPAEAGPARQANGQPQRNGVAPLTQPAVQDGRVLVAPVDGTKALTTLLGPGSPVEQKLRIAVSRTRGAVDEMLKAGAFQADLMDASEPDVLSGPALPYAHYQLHHLKTPEAIARWLLSGASDEQREKFLTGINEAAEMMEDLEDKRTGASIGDDTKVRLAGSVEQFEKHLEELERLSALSHPFAEANEDMVVADPEQGRPQPFPAILALGDKVANYDRFLQTAAEDDVKLAQMIQLLSTERDRKRVVQAVLAKWQGEAKKDAPDQDALLEARSDLEAAQRAWSYLEAREIAEEVDEAPKAEAGEGPVKKAHQRSRLVWHSPSESFSKRVLAQLGL